MSGYDLVRTDPPKPEHMTEIEEEELTEVQREEPGEHFRIRDPIQTASREVFAEPRHFSTTGTGLVPLPRENLDFVFDKVQATVYYDLSVTLGFLLSLMWGIIFGISNFLLVWMFQPSLRLALSWYRVVSGFTEAVIRGSVDPVCRSFSILFSLLSGKVAVRSKRAPEGGVYHV